MAQLTKSLKLMFNRRKEQMTVYSYVFVCVCVGGVGGVCVQSADSIHPADDQRNIKYRKVNQLHFGN